MPVDLSYAKSGEQEAPPQLVVMTISVKGWCIGWSLFRDGRASQVGSFTVRDHVVDKETNKNIKVPTPDRNMGAFRAVASVAQTAGISLIVSHNPDPKAPLWALASSIAAALGVGYKDFPGWRKHVGADVKELRAWATVVAGKAPDNDEEVYALGLGAAFSRDSVKLQEGPLTGIS